MRIDEALKLSDIVVTPGGFGVEKSKDKENSYWHIGSCFPLENLMEVTGGNLWQPAYVRPQFQVGDKVSFLQACLSGQCFQKSPNDDIRRCVNLVSGEMRLYHIVTKNWIFSTREFCTSDTVTIVADPSQEPKKPKRTRQEIVAEMNQLLEELCET